jgi:hypothetical protein
MAHFAALNNAIARSIYLTIRRDISLPTCFAPSHIYSPMHHPLSTLLFGWLLNRLPKWQPPKAVTSSISLFLMPLISPKYKQIFFASNKPEF